MLCCLSWLVEGAVLSFLGFSAAAMARYPGGTFWDRNTPGHSFWHNFLCDLTQTPALNGEPNLLGAELATFGMLSLVVSMVAFVGIVPALLHDARMVTRRVKAVAMIACGLTALVPLLPSDRFGNLHAVVVFVAGVPVSLALMALVSSLLREGKIAGFLRVLSIVLCVALAGSLALYASEVLFHTRPLRIVPALARLANLCLAAWLIGLARLARQRALHDPLLAV